MESPADLARRLVAFIRTLGIAVHERDLPVSFLPGMDIGEGGVMVDYARIAHPGDLLHEAGHVAVAPPEQRAAEKFAPGGGDEMAAIAWSYAAAKIAGLDSKVLFHDDYKGGGPAIREAFDGGRYFGVPLLDYYGMCVDPRRAAPDGPKPFPHMLRWVR